MGDDEPQPPATRLNTLFRAGFLALLLVELGSHSAYYQSGPLTWGAIPLLPSLLPFAERFGPLALLPPLLLGGWLLWRLRDRGRHDWRWGPRAIVLPLAALCALSLLSLPLEGSLRVMGQLLLWGVLWGVYLYVVNDRPPLTGAIALVVLVQSGVAIGQFALQRDLGLGLLGELALDPARTHISVLLSGEQRWLRGYGLTGHPNALGGMLAALLLLLAAPARGATGARALLRRGALLVGLLGLLVTFSRSAWLAFAAGGVTLLVTLGRAALPGRRARALLVPLALIPLLFGARYGDLVRTRFFELESSIERRSLEERARDYRIALELWAAAPLVGVGAGAYPDLARGVDPRAAVVHNIPLLVAVELGLLGLALWVIIALAPLVSGSIRERAPPGALAAWVAWLIFGLFQPAQWPWFAAVPGTLLMALLLGTLVSPSPAEANGGHP